MSEQNETAAAPAATEPKAKQRKPKAAKAAKPSKTPVTMVQYKTLKALSKAPNGLTRKKISEKAFNGNSVNFAPILAPLMKAKMVKQVEIDVDGKTETIFEIMAAGRKVADGQPPRREGGAQHQPLPKVGGVITKTYLDKEFKVTVTADGFKFGNKTYPSLTATAKAIRGSDQEINGWAFFGLTKTESAK